MKPLVGVIHELPLPKVLEIAYLMNHTQIQQRQKLIIEEYPLLYSQYPIIKTRIINEE
jgi:hypothetical protein